MKNISGGVECFERVSEGIECSENVANRREHSLDIIAQVAGISESSSGIVDALESILNDVGISESITIGWCRNHLRHHRQCRNRYKRRHRCNRDHRRRLNQCKMRYRLNTSHKWCDKDNKTVGCRVECSRTIGILGCCCKSNRCLGGCHK